MSSFKEAIQQELLPKAKYLSAFSLGCSLMILVSCTTTRTIPIETLRHDTLYINKEKFDSTYLSVEHWQEYHPSTINHESLITNRIDTIFIKDVSIEYRYRMQNDTIYKSRIDTIPYEVRITEVKEVRKPPNLFDYLCYLSFGILISIAGWKLIKIIPSRH